MRHAALAGVSHGRRQLGQALGAKNDVRAIGGMQHETGALHGRGEMIGQPVGGAGFARFTSAQLAHQVAGVDADRAALGTEAGGGAGFDAVVVVEALDLGGIDTGALACLDVAPDDDALAWGEGQSVGRADRLAETALDALVDDLVGSRHRLEVLQVDVRVFGEHHVGVEDAGGVEQALDLPHQRVGFAAPFQLDEGRHVAPGAVLGLERAAEFDGDQLRHFAHEGFVTGDLGRIIEALGEDEVQVALQCVAEEDRLVVAVLVEQLDQAIDALGQAFDGEGHVLDDHRGAGLAHGADRGEGVLADLPQLVVDQRVFAEVDLLLHREMRDGGHDQVDLLVQQRLAGGARFDQQCAGGRRQFLHPLGHAGLVLDRAQAATVKQLHGGHRLLLEHRYGEAAGFHVGKHHQRAGLVRMVRHGVVGHCADEAQRAFGTDHQVVEDIQRLVIVDQRIERETGGVLQAVLVTDLRREFAVGSGLAPEFGQLIEQCCVALAEGGNAGGIFAVDHSAVCQYDTQPGEGLVRVLRSAAAHAAGIVGDDAADLGGIDRGRIRTDLALKRREYGVGVGADDAGLQADLLAAVANLAAVPVVAEHDQHRVADRLAGQAGARGAEGHRDAFRMGQLEQRDHLGFGFDAHHQFGNQPVKAGVGAEGEGGERIVEAPLDRDQALDFAEDFGRQRRAFKLGGRVHASSRISRIRSFGPWAP